MTEPPTSPRAREETPSAGEVSSAGSSRRLEAPTETLLAEAERFLAQLVDEGLAELDEPARCEAIRREVASTGTYRQTLEELLAGAQLAWRHSTRCVGRLYWQGLKLQDFRDASSAEEVFAGCVEHLRRSTNGGKIQPMITVFPARRPDGSEVRILNEQLIRYAGYRQPDGSVLGDPQLVELTELALELGWDPGERTPFDVLPLVIRMGGERPRLFELPEDAVLEVPIRHPELDLFEELDLRWHALPAIANMRLEIGGLHYTAAPFSGWYVITEIAARNLADPHRYDLLPTVARHMGLDTEREDSLWRDRALVELNRAVLASYRRAGVRVLDHHTAARHFVDFEEREARSGRETYADWAWIVPPTAGSATPVFHRHYRERQLTPNFFHQETPGHQSKPTRSCPVHA